MTLDTSRLLVYASLALVVFYLVAQIASTRHSWTIWAAVIAMVLVLFVSTRPKPAESPPVTVPDETDSEVVETPAIPSTYQLQDKSFRLVKGKMPNTTQVRYKDFVRWYLSPDFLAVYTEAVKTALRLKRKRLVQVRNMYLHEPVDRRFYSSEDSVVKQIDDLLTQINQKAASLGVDDIRQGLISAVAGIDSLTGREEVKDFIALQLYTFARNPRVFLSNFQNIAIYGPSGVGKTKLAKVIGHAYASSGILVRDHVQVITKQALTTAYVNESARITRKLLMSNLEAVVFLDEAYDITPPPTLLGPNVADHGREAITEMVNFMDKMKGLAILIAAGYEEEMESRFMKANEGLPRRFPHKIILQPYTPKELTEILLRFLASTCPDIVIGERQADYLYTAITYLHKHHPDVLKTQAGAMENLSAHIARAVYGTPGKSWPKDAESLVLAGINAFLAQSNTALEQGP